MASMILVTAANGHLGQEVIAALVQQTSADQIIASARDLGNLSATADKGLKCRPVDYDDPGTLDSACQGIHTLILIPSPAPKMQRIQQHRQVIAAAQTHHVRTIVFVSFMDVREDSPLSYAHIFADTEKALAESGLAWTNMRMPYYINNLLNWLPEALQRGEFCSSAGEGRMPYVTQADLAESIAIVATREGHAGKTFELTGPAALNYDDIAMIATEIYGKAVTYQSLTPEEYQHWLRRTGATEFRIETALGLAAAIQEGRFDHVTNHVQQAYRPCSRKRESILQTAPVVGHRDYPLSSGGVNLCSMSNN